MIEPVQQTEASVSVLRGDCLEKLKELPDNSVDSCVTDPPSGISFMGKSWDSNKGGRTQWVAWLSEVMAEVMRVVKPGGHALVWALPRTSHWTALALEDAGWEIRDVCHHIFGSGFPKSKNLGNGWGTALKPAVENWILCRAPLSEKSASANYSRWGTGGLNIGATRIGGFQQQNNPAHEIVDSASADTASAAGELHQSSGVHFPLLESALDSLRSVSSALRFDSSSCIDPSPNGDARGDSQPSDASSGRKHLDRLYPNGAWCGLNVNEALGSQPDCPACHRLYDELFRGIQEAAQESPASLADALEHMCLALPEQGHSHNCQCIDRPSSSGVLGRISALADLLIGNTIIPYSTHPQPQGRFPANLLLSHVPPDENGEGGCQQVGSKRVKSGTAHEPTPKRMNRSIYGTTNTLGRTEGYADPDGTEEVPDYICEESCPVRLLDEQSGERKAGGRLNGGQYADIGYHGNGTYREKFDGYGDKGGSSRFFQTFPRFKYQAKASKRDRTANGTVANSHPTTKPTELMKYLLRLGTPDNGTCLDPFAGSGTTGVAALSEGFSAILIEQDEEYADIAEARCAHVLSEVSGRLPL